MPFFIFIGFKDYEERTGTLHPKKIILSSSICQLYRKRNIFHIKHHKIAKS